MQWLNKKLITIISNIIIIAWSLLLGSPLYASSNLEQQRNLFLQIEADIKSGNNRSFYRHKKDLQNYPLFPYLQFEYIKKNINNTSSKKLNNFLSQYADSPLANRLRTHWLEHKSKTNNWHHFVQAYQPSANIELQCNFIYAHLKVHKNPSILEQVKPIWLYGKSRPKACDKVFLMWEQANLKTRAFIWQRIKLAIKANNIKLVRYLSKSLNVKEQKYVELWIRANKNPKLAYKEYYFTAKHPVIKEILIHCITKIAKTDPKQAIKLWQKVSVLHTFNKHHRGIVLREISINLVNHHYPEARAWLQKIPTMYINRRVLHQHLKLALYNNDWQAIYNLYNNLPANIANEQKWKYWYARASEMLGEKLESRAIFMQLAENRSYYGFLASLRSLKPYNFQDQYYNKINQHDILQLINIPAVQRAQELHYLQRPHLGSSEWYHALRNMDEHQRQTAAILATKLDIPNWSIIALADAKNKNNLSLRFPKNYSNYILKAAKQNRIDPALIFAITRQESAFIPFARSPAGALGLMQLMPTTAKMIAKQTKLKLRGNNDILKADKNITLGSKYFKMMLEKYQNNPVLAAAAYNAGPTRIKRWLPKNDMPADSWIETIPIPETYNYVKNILAYTVIYQRQLGKKPRLSSHMPVVMAGG